MEQALQSAEDWGVKPLSPEKLVEKKHIFTHVEWNMLGVYITCSRQDERFLWAEEEELRERYALPTAFRQFLE